MSRQEGKERRWENDERKKARMKEKERKKASRVSKNSAAQKKETGRRNQTYFIIIVSSCGHWG